MALPTTHRAADRHARPAARPASRSTRSRSRAARATSACCRATRRCSPSLAVGELWYRKGQEKTYLSIAFGFAEVLPDRVTILARLAERADDIDVERAEAARKRAEERLAQRTDRDVDYERARIALLKSLDAAAGVGARSAWDRGPAG